MAAWLAVLTIAAFVLAQGASTVLRRSLDAASSVTPVTVAENRLEKALPLLPRSDAADRNGSASVREDYHGGVKVEQVSDTQWIVDRASLLASTRDLNRFLMQARTEPVAKQGRIAGFRITRISHGSIYEKIGLRQGDVLLRVNTRNLDDPSRLFSLYQAMRNKRHISLLLSRNGRDQTFDYDIR